MTTSVNHKLGSPRVRVHGQGCGTTGAAVSMPRPRAAAAQISGGVPRARVSLFVPRPPRAQSLNCPCWGHLVALPRFPFVPRGGRALEEVRPLQVLSLAFCPRPASGIPLAPPLGTKFSAAARPELGAPYDVRACTPADRPARTRAHTAHTRTHRHAHAFSQSLAMSPPTHGLTHAYMLTFSGTPQPRARVGGMDPSQRDSGCAAGGPVRRRSPNPSTVSQLPTPPSSLRGGPR